MIYFLRNVSSQAILKIFILNLTFKILQDKLNVGIIVHQDLVVEENRQLKGCEDRRIESTIEDVLADCMNVMIMIYKVLVTEDD